jgi:hypothetical protein
MKFLAILGLLFIGFQTMKAAAAPACSTVFFGSQVSEADLDSTLSKLAQLKIHADQNMALGKSASQFERNQIKSLYEKKWTELVAKLQHQVPESVLKAKLSKKIGEIQSGNKTEKEEEKQSRIHEVHKMEVKVPHYKLKSTEHFPVDLTELDMGSLFKYLPEQKSLLIAAGLKLIRYNIETHEQTELAHDAISPQVSQDNKRVVYYDRAQNLIELEISTGKMNSHVKVDIPDLTRETTQIRLRISPDGKTAIIFDLENASQVNIATGEFKNISFAGDIGRMFDADFLTNDAINIQTSSKLVQYDLRTMKQIADEHDWVRFLTLKESGHTEIPLIYHRPSESLERVSVYSANDLGELYGSSRAEPKSLNPTEQYHGTLISSIPGIPGFLLLRPLSPTEKNETMIVHARDIATPLFEFNNFYGPQNNRTPVSVAPIAFAADRSELIIITAALVSLRTQYFLDRWTIDTTHKESQGQ